MDEVAIKDSSHGPAGPRVSLGREVCEGKDSSRAMGEGGAAELEGVVLLEIASNQIHSLSQFLHILTSARIFNQQTGLEATLISISELRLSSYL